MKRVRRDGLTLLVFEHLEQAGLVCAISTLPIDVREPEGARRFVKAAGLDPDQIATARQNGARWHEVLKRMRADGLIEVRTLDGVIRHNARLGEPARPARKVAITNGMGRHVVVTTRSRPQRH